MFIHMLVSFIDIIKHFIHPRLVGVPQYHQESYWIKDVVHHIDLAEEQGIIYVVLDNPMMIILQF